MSESGTRGIRNNNPGNIRHGAQWQGMAQDQMDASFVQFTDAKFGIRAIARILLSYERQGYNTVRQIINRWAPPNENNTDAYIAAVAHDCHLGVDEAMDVQALLAPLVTAIIQHENGSQPYPLETIAQGVALA